MSFETIASVPAAVFQFPVVLSRRAAAPTAVLELPLLSTSAPPPTPVLKLPSVVAKSARQPNAEFPAPVVSLRRASSPCHTLKRPLLQPSRQAACVVCGSAKRISRSGTKTMTRRKRGHLIDPLTHLIIVDLR